MRFIRDGGKASSTDGHQKCAICGVLHCPCTSAFYHPQIARPVQAHAIGVVYVGIIRKIGHLCLAKGPLIHEKF